MSKVLSDTLRLAKVSLRRHATVRQYSLAKRTMPTCEKMKSAILCACVFSASSAMASTAAELDWKKVPPVCGRFTYLVGELADARDKGDSRSAALARNKTASAYDALSELAINNVFDYPKLNRPALENYAMWSCHANGNGHSALPLSAVYTALATCIATPSDDPCLRKIRDAVLGITRDAAQTSRDTPDMVALRRTPTNKAPPRSQPPMRVAIPGSCAAPVYPRESLRNEEKGAVTIRLLLDAEGAVLMSKVVDSSGFDRLDQAALTAFDQCRFAPLIVNGKASSGFVRAGWVFSLD